MKEEDLWNLNLTEMAQLVVPPGEPPRVSMYPETQGWVWLAVIAATALVAGLFLWWRHRQANEYRRIALMELDESDGTPAEIATVLRRVALVAYPRDEVVALAGDDWLRFLDGSFGKNRFLSDIGQKLVTAPYRTVADPVPGLEELARDWIRNHKTRVRP